jgi:hypothetical protein
MVGATPRRCRGSLSARSLLVVAFFLILAACGGSLDLDSLPSSTVDIGSPVATQGTETPGTAFEEQSFTVNQEFWHIGFRVELGDGTLFATEDEITKEVRYFASIDTTFENLGTSSLRFDSDLVIVTPDGNFPVHGTSDKPEVPGGLSATGTLVFRVDESFDITSAQLIVGRSDLNQAKIPLGPQGGALVSLEPSEPAPPGPLSLELIDLTFTSADLRADKLSSNRQLEDGKLALTLNFDATSRRDGNWTVLAPNFALVLPDGTATAPSASELSSLAGGAGGIDTSGLSVTFLVNSPGSGAYTLRFQPGTWFVGDDGVDSASVDFTIP